MEEVEIKKITVDKFHEQYIKKFAKAKYPLFSIIVFNSSVWHEAITSHRRDEDRVLAKLWTPNLSRNYFMELLDESIL